MNKTAHYGSFASLRTLPKTTFKSRSISILASTDLLAKKQPFIFGDYKTYQEELIGMGSCSRVYRGIHSKTNENVALKVINVQKLSSKVEKRFLKNEIQCLKQLRKSKFIVQLKQVIYTKKVIVIVSDLCQDTLLKTMKKQSKNKHPLNQAQAFKIFQQIVEGYLNMRQFGFIHRDIKPANILIDGDGSAILADLGFATSDSKIFEDRRVKAGSPLYMAPEILKDNAYSAKGDIWSLGIVLLEMLIGDLPWVNAKQSLLHQILLITDFEEVIPEALQDKWRKIVLMCLQKNVSKRCDEMELMRLVNPKYDFKMACKINKAAELEQTVIITDDNQTKQMITTQSDWQSQNVNRRAKSLSLKERLIKSKSKQLHEQTGEKKKVFKLLVKDRLQADKLIEIKLNCKQILKVNRIKQEQTAKLNLAKKAIKILQIIQNNTDNIHCSYLNLKKSLSVSLVSFFLTTIDEIKQLKSGYSCQQIQNFKGSKDYRLLCQMLQKQYTKYRQYFSLKFGNNSNVPFQIEDIIKEVKQEIDMARQHVSLIYSELRDSGLQQIGDDEIGMFMYLIQHFISFHKYINMYKNNRQLFMRLNKISEITIKQDNITKLQDIRRIIEQLEK